MPLIKFSQSKQHGGWAIWFIHESRDALQSMVNESVPHDIVHIHKQQEWLAGRLLTKTLANKLALEYNGMRKDESGKPFPIEYDYHISLSHSFPYVAAQVDNLYPVGIDIEQPKDKLLRIAPRIMSPAELIDAGTDIQKHCVYWCAKEAMYKLHGKGGLHFSNQLNIQPFLLQAQGTLQGTITTSDGKQIVPLQYQVGSDYVLVLTLT